MVEIKGTIVNGSIKAVKIRSGDQVYNDIPSRLDEQARQLFEKPILNAGWCLFDSCIKFLEEDIKSTANGNEHELEIRSAAFNEEFLRDIYGSFVKSESPEFFIKRHSILHQVYFRGDSIEITFDEPNKAIVQYIGFEKQHRLVQDTIVGFYKNVLTIAGVKNIQTKYLTSIEDDKKLL